MNEETVNVGVAVDTTQFDSAMQDLREQAEQFGSTFASSITRAVRSGKSFEDTLRSIGQRLTDLALNQAIKPLENAFGDLLGGVTNALVGGLTGGATGGGANTPVLPFAKGGVISQPTGFAFANGLGLMGEKGPEAIIPLKRGSDGALGVAAPANGQPVNVVFNVQAKDAESFHRSEGQLTSLLARAVSRGTRRL